jgi:hypothetical protein
MSFIHNDGQQSYRGKRVAALRVAAATRNVDKRDFYHRLLTLFRAGMHGSTPTATAPWIQPFPNKAGRQFLL